MARTKVKSFTGFVAPTRNRGIRNIEEMNMDDLLIEYT